MNSSENSKFEIDYDTCHMIDIDYLKKQFEPTDDDKEFEYNPMSISKIQNYNPIYTIFFKMDEKVQKLALNVDFNFLILLNSLDKVLLALLIFFFLFFINV